MLIRKGDIVELKIRALQRDYNSEVPTPRTSGLSGRGEYDRCSNTFHLVAILGCDQGYGLYGPNARL